MASSEFSYDPTRLPRVSAAKVSIPPRPSDLLRRPRLLDFLHENIHRKLILVCAAAGYGKSSLLIDFVHDTDYAVAWYRLDESDIDLATLVAGLVAAIRVPFPDFQFVLPEFVAQPDATPHELATALIREIEAALHDYFILTLDDFHVVQDSPSILRFFDVLLADLPEQAHLLIAGRTLPPLRIASLADRQQIAGLSEEHLRFTPAETRALIQLRNGVSVPEEESDKLAADTEGWITGILLTSHLMWQGLIASLMQARQSEVPLYEYLADEVLDQQPDLLKQFLLESSVLPEMNPAVCDQVLVRLDSAKRLEQAEASRLFVSVIGDEFRTYQYHHLFRDFLLSRLRDQDPGRLQILQMRAGEWYAGNGMPEAAVSFYVQAGQLDRAAQLAEAHAPAMFASGRHATLRRWGDQLEPVAYGAPQLYRFLGAAAIDAGRTDVAEHALEVATVGFAQRGDQGGSLDVDVQRSLLMYRRGQFENALALAEAAVRKAQELGRPGPAAEGLRYAGLSQFALGNLSGAEVLLQQAASLLKSTRNHYDLAWVLTDLAWVLYSRGQLAYAIQLQQEALAIWRERGYPGPLALALNNLGWGMHMLGHLQAALATYDAALGWAQRAGSNRW